MPPGLSELAPLAWPHAPWLLLLAVLVSFLAGVVRGFAGFGYSALVVAALSPFVPPGPVVVAVLVLEVLASLRVLRQAGPLMDRGWRDALLGGNLLFVPLGMAGLAWLDPGVVRVVVAALLLAGALGVRLVIGRRLQATASLRATAAASSGLLNGFAASGGIVAALLMAATGMPAATLRATMINLLMWISAYALLWGAALSFVGRSPLFGAHALGWLLLLWAPLLVGMRVGGRAFERTDARRQARLVLDVLIGAAALGLLVACLARPA